MAQNLGREDIKEKRHTQSKYDKKGDHEVYGNGRWHLNYILVK